VALLTTAAGALSRPNRESLIKYSPKRFGAFTKRVGMPIARARRHWIRAAAARRFFSAPPRSCRAHAAPAASLQRLAPVRVHNRFPSFCLFFYDALCVPSRAQFEEPFNRARRGTRLRSSPAPAVQILVPLRTLHLLRRPAPACEHSSPPLFVFFPHDRRSAIPARLTCQFLPLVQIHALICYVVRSV